MSDITHDDLTILIPSKARAKELCALLGYFDHHQITYKIIILESGNTYRDMIGSYPSLNIELHEFDMDIPFAAKLIAGTQLVKTSLVCICTDDDLVLKDGMEECARFLVDHPEYSACQGYHGRFEQKDSDFYLLDILWFTPSLDSCDPMMRLQDLITRYQPICWAVFRTEVFLRMHREFVGIHSPLFFELFWSSMAAIVGKVKRIPTLYCLRKNDELQVFGHPLYLFAESPERFFSDYLTYRACLEKALFHENKSLDKERRILDLMHSCLFHFATDQSTLRYMTQKAIENPEMSILNPEIYKSLQIYKPLFQEEGSSTIPCEKRTYHFAAKFLNPEPSDEIKMQPTFHLKLMTELDAYSEVDF